jgi:hypothetical protein
MQAIVFLLKIPLRVLAVVVICLVIVLAWAPLFLVWPNGSFRMVDAVMDRLDGLF